MCADGAQQYKLTQQSSAQPEFGPDVASLDMNVSYITPNIMRVKIGAPGRWEFPMSLLNTTVKPGKSPPIQLACRARTYGEHCWRGGQL